MQSRFSKRVFTLSVATIISAALLFALLASDSSATAQAQTTDTPTPEATTEPVDEQGVENFPPLEGKINPPQFPNMDSNLNRIVQQVQTGQFTAQAAAAGAPIHQEESVAITFYVAEGYAQDVWDWLEESGASPRNIGIDYIEAYVPVSLLPNASEREGVISIRTIVPPQPAQDTVVSEGVAAHGVPAWHDAGIRGQGVKIGIIDVSFEGFTELMGSELPATAQWRCYTQVGVFTSNPTDCVREDDPESSKIHGTAVTEAVFDIAPEAEYYIANTSSWGDLLDTVDWMTTQGVDVMNLSVSFAFAGPGDGTSPFSNSPLTSVDEAVAGDIVWVNSAGNMAQTNLFMPFTDPNANGLHDFSATGDECNGVRIQLDPLEGFTALLRWDDSWGGAEIDLDLYLIPVTPEGTITLLDAVASSEDAQVGGERNHPFELISLSYGNIPNGMYCLAIDSFSDTAPSWIQIHVWGPPSIEHYTPDHSITNPAESANPGLIAVGASGRNAGSDDNSFDNPFDTTIIEPFSSQGPTLDDRIKPDIVGADAGQSVTYRSERNPNGYFFGTSQASPHVAGLAALVRQRFPNQTPEQIANYLKDHAEDRGDTGADNIWGHGFANLPASDVISSPTTDSCVQPLTGSSTIDGSWDSEIDCPSVEPAHDGRNRYARFYTFTLTEAAEVTVALESKSAVDTYLYLRQGAGRDNTTSLCENDDYRTLIPGPCALIESSLDSNTDSGISADLAAGDYTIEATTYDPETIGDFTLAVSGLPAGVEPEPAPTPGTDVVVSAGPNHACTLNSNGEIACRGIDDSIQVSGRPTGAGYIALSVGGKHSCAIDSDGSVECWGADESGQVSDHPTSSGFVAVSVGGKHSCVIDSNGGVECWGSNEHGQASTPTHGTFVAIGAGDNYTCGLRSDNNMECWGRFEAVDESAPTPPAPNPTPDPGAIGTRSNPVPLGQYFQPPTSPWELKVVSVDWDAWPEIQAENQLNESPAAGNQFVMVTIMVRNTGSSADRFSSSRISAVGSQSVEYRTSVNHCGVIPDDFSDITRLFPSGELQGNICYEVASSDISSLLLFGDYLALDANFSNRNELWFWALR